MTVAELLKHLEGLDPQDVVVLATDIDNDEYIPLADVSADMFRLDTSRYGDVKAREAHRLPDDTDEDIGKSEDGFVPCVTLWPK